MRWFGVFTAMATQLFSGLQYLSWGVVLQADIHSLRLPASVLSVMTGFLSVLLLCKKPNFQ